MSVPLAAVVGQDLDSCERSSTYRDQGVSLGPCSGAECRGSRVRRPYLDPLSRAHAHFEVFAPQPPAVLGDNHASVACGRGVTGSVCMESSG